MSSNKVIKYLSVFLLCVVYIDALKLPSYIKPCSMKKNLNECAKKHAIAALPELVKGDAKYKIPKLNPLTIPEITMQASENLKVRLTDAVVSGLPELDIQSLDIDIEGKKFYFKANIPRANLLGTYDIDGRILILPITGKGPANITFVDGVYEVLIHFNVIEKNGKEYLEIADTKLTYETKRSYFQLDNLFNGDARLGPEMNKFLNENWKEVSNDIGPALSDTISSIINSIVAAIFVKVPFNELFTE